MKKYIHFDVEHSVLENQINMWADNGYKLVAFTCYENKIYSGPLDEKGFMTHRHIRMYAVIMEKIDATKT